MLALSSIVLWLVSAVLLWMSGESNRADNWIYEPAVVGGTLGYVGIAWFAAIYFREDATGQNVSHRLRSAIAGSVVLVFLLLVVDLLTISGLRESLDGLGGSGTGNANPVAQPATAEEAFTFVEGILDTFKWVVITVVGFYFAAGAAEAVGKNVEEKAKTRADADIEIAKESRATAEAQMRTAEATRDAALADGRKPPP